MGCVPLAHMPPPHQPNFKGIGYGLAVVAPQPLSPALGFQGWGMKRIDKKTALGFRVANVNTLVVSTIGGGVFYRRTQINNTRKFRGWEAELGIGYLRLSSLNAYRNKKMQVYFSPGLQLQPNLGVMEATLPLGITLWQTNRYSISAELSTSLYLSHLLAGGFSTRINPTLGVAF